jgi:hypothetical protein
VQPATEAIAEAGLAIISNGPSSKISRTKIGGIKHLLRLPSWLDQVVNVMAVVSLVGLVF